MNKYYLRDREAILKEKKERRAKDDEFRKQQDAYAQQYAIEHPEYTKKYGKEWRQQHPNYHIEYTLAIKKEVLTHYGNGKCGCVLCGFQDIKALSIDHINGDGNRHRKQIGKSSGINFYMWLKKNNYPLGYRTLCMNCQYITKK